MRTLNHLFENNRRWASDKTQKDPRFFSRLVQQQTPEYLWIGCADSRVPANEIVGLQPGELFVHRNVANLAIQTDINFLSVLQYAVDILHICHIIVCGHYGCGGVRAAIEKQPHGLINNWLSPIREVYRKHESCLRKMNDRDRMLDRLCELNVIEQVRQVVQSSIVQEAWQRNQSLCIHGWIYRLSDGLLQDTGMCVASNADMASSPSPTEEAAEKESGQI
ncbi:MAG: carbonate dehydratase [Phycisphaerae bacterium]|nr:carbonate dehydratase [Phycisphaerae bacterium]